ncbi:MAG: flagellar biosynthesis protein FlgJ, partial [Phycisphaerae bacterium]|nr:flagellar biosynthesis protein FlgJ [Gammaproteobacteria bacterium]NIR48119.1 flagellar biosynthesis protein FlgJ [candidate division KSB1 bacterium]NIR67314.1 flagellar biosynthesis protein FlgJ [candidate division Zixibacteria bacterium]NIV02576.1 flagellar biosynthesis protein FlgJ [Phycisphaerae bacterium]NIQ10427.1 flagellar biosynthesis protein FlgJ [Gammaproteobacteria bacterium]
MKDGDRERIREIAERYGLRGRPLIDHRIRSLLLRRVDTLPPALVLAQAANESAWGTSRFARLGNNIFGEWTFKPGTGIVPEGRPEGATYEVRKFKSIYQSIRSYINNINRHNAYRNLRRIREKLRKSSKQVTGTALAKGLEKYSQRGEAYVKEIQLMIRQNNLERINTASLRLPT